MSLRTYKTFTPVIGDRVYVDESAQVIGRVTIGDDSSIWPCTTLRGDVNTIEIGSGTSIQDGSVLHVTHDHPDKFPGGFPLRVGSHVTVGHNVVLHGCTIEDYCLIGMGAVVLDGAHIEKHVFLAAGSLVSPGKRLESGFLYMGSPARKIRPLTEEDIEAFEYSAQHYIRLKNDYL